MTETIIMVALVAIGTIGIIGLFGDNIRSLFAASSDSLAGADSVKNPGSKTTGSQQKTMATFGKATYAGGPMNPGGG